MQKLRPILSSLVSILVNLILWPILIIIYTFPLLLGFSIRLTINVIAKRLQNLIPLSPNDILLIRQTPSNQPGVNGGIILRFKGRLDYQKFQGLFREIFLTPENYERYQNFYCDVTSFGGYLFKRVLYTDGSVDKRFGYNLQEHFDQKVIPGGNIKHELAQWYQTKYKEGLPLWQVLFAYCEGEDESYLGFKGSHALFDGYSFVHILDKLTGVSSSTEGECSEEGSPRFSWREILLFLTLPQVTVCYLLRHFWFPDNLPKLPHLTNVEMLPAAFGTVDLAPVKEIRRKLGVRFPSIIFSLQVGALRRTFLESRKEEELPKVFLVSTSFPVRNHPRNTLVNHWSGGTIKVPLRSSSAKERVLGTNKSYEQMTGDEGPYLIWKYVSHLLWLLPASVLYPMSFSNISLYRYRSSISVIPQSTSQYFLMGEPVLNIFHAPLMKDCFPRALMLGCSSSHKDQVDFSLFGHPELFPNQDLMDNAMNNFKLELQQLLNECEFQPELQLNWRDK